MIIEGSKAEQNSEAKPVEGDKADKTDSGMEEGSNFEPLALDDSEDEEEEVIIKKHTNKSKTRLILDEDSDNEEETTTTTTKPQVFTAEEALHAVLEDSSDDNGDKLETPSTGKKRKIKRPVTDDSSDDEVGQKDEGHLKNKNLKDSKEESNDADTEEQSDNIPSESRKDDKLQQTEDSDSSDSRSSSGSDSEHSDNNNDDDEGFNEDSIDPKLLAKLKKGAGKKPKSARISKREEMMSLHSESQRIVREGRVNLPYHQPAPKSLNDFLARASKKQQEYRNLTGSVRNQRKAKVIEDVLQNSRLQTRAKTQEELDQYSDSDEDYDPTKSLMERVAEKLQESGKKVDETENTETSETKTDCEEKSTENEIEISEVTEKVNMNSEDSQDSLPDLYVEKETAKSSDKDHLNVENSAQVLTADSSAKADSLALNDSEKTISDKPLNVPEELDQRNTENLNEKMEHSGVEVMDVDVESSGKYVLKDKEFLNENKENVGENISSKSNDTENKTSPSQATIPSPKSAKKLKKERLLALAGIDLNVVKPCLSGDTESFISLVEAEEAPKHPGVVKLMDRLTKHAAKKEKKKSRDMDISIVSKDKIGMDKEELKLNTFTYHIEEEDSNPLMKLETPGAKLMALKEQLQVKIKEKREEARQKRQELYNLDNEEGDFGAEEEEEMSEHSDTDVDEDEEFDEQFGGEYDDEEEMITEKKRKINAFADEEAHEDGEEVDEGGLDDDDVVSDGDDDGDDEGAEADDEDYMNLKLDVSDDEEGDSVEAVKDKAKKSNRKTSEAPLNEESDTKDVQDFKEPSPKKLPDKPFSMFGQRSSSRDSSFADTQLQSGQKSTSLRLQIEDSQDLYGTLPQLAPTQEPSISQSSPQNYNFLLEDSQSVMLDADGYLKTKSTSKPRPVSKISVLDDLSRTQDDMDVLGLCSGKFVSQVESKDKTSKKSLFDDCSVSNTQNMEDFMGLCSGVFTESKTNSSQTQGKKRNVSSDDNDSIEALSDNEERNSDKDEESENENDHDTDDLGDDEEVEGETDDKQKQFTGFLQKRGKIRKEFVEEEAELSGSEFDSDENLDLPEEEDIMELEEADKDVANIDQEQLRDEVGRVHLKQMIDEDKRELLRFQEMYLADGDLHSEGGGRMRRFRWSNIDDDTQQDMFADGSDDEGHEQDDTEELKWRKERHEREKFLKDQQDKEVNDSENSQFLKFGKVFLKRQESVDSNSAKKDSRDSKQGDNQAGNQAETPGFPGSFYKLSKQKRGSFLARSKEALAKIAEMTKPATNPSAGAKSSGKFTFHVISPDKEGSQQPSPAGKVRKAHKPATNTDASFKKPPMKRQKLDTTVKAQSSIFNHL